MYTTSSHLCKTATNQGGRKCAKRHGGFIDSEDPKNVCIRRFVAKLNKIYTHQVWFCTETVKILHTQLNSNKRATKITDLSMHLRCFFSRKIFAFCAFLVCKFCGPKNLSCKFLTNLKSENSFGKIDHIMFKRMGMGGGGQRLFEQC